jgi:type III restriction enzyme
VPFKNVVVEYPLARAMDDGFVKEPAVVTQRNFDAKALPPEELERVKLRDGVRMHEATKVELKTYARSNGVKEVKPFMLVIARDTTRCSPVGAFAVGRIFCRALPQQGDPGGQQQERRGRRGDGAQAAGRGECGRAHRDRDPREHAQEGWDVTNLYTIVPLRAANARTLVEQSIGRGLRLPYGKRTGVAAVDRLSIIAHDRFQEIIDDANKADSPMRLKTFLLDAPEDGDGPPQSVTVAPSLSQALGLADGAAQVGSVVTSVVGNGVGGAAQHGLAPPRPPHCLPQSANARPQRW